MRLFLRYYSWYLNLQRLLASQNLFAGQIAMILFVFVFPGLTGLLLSALYCNFAACTDDTAPIFILSTVALTAVYTIASAILCKVTKEKSSNRE